MVDESVNLPPVVPSLRVALDRTGKITSGPLLDTAMAPTLIFTSAGTPDATLGLWRTAGVQVCVVYGSFDIILTHHSGALGNECGGTCWDVLGRSGVEVVAGCGSGMGGGRVYGSVDTVWTVLTLSTHILDDFHARLLFSPFFGDVLYVVTMLIGFWACCPMVCPI